MLLPPPPAHSLLFSISLGCCSNNGYRNYGSDDNMLMFQASNSVGWCVIDQEYMDVEVADSSTYVFSTFHAQW